MPGALAPSMPMTSDCGASSLDKVSKANQAVDQRRMLQVGSCDLPARLQSDAACRVIARLIRERDEARHLLAQAERQLARGVPPEAVSAAPAQPMANGKRGGGPLHGAWIAPEAERNRDRELSSALQGRRLMCSQLSADCSRGASRWGRQADTESSCLLLRKRRL